MSDENRIEVILSAKIDELNASLQQAVSGTDSSITEMSTKLGQIETASESAGRSMGQIANLEALSAAKSALEGLLQPIIQIGEECTHAAQAEAQITRNLQAAGMEGAKLSNTIGMIHELAEGSNYSAEAIAHVVQRMEALGPVSQETLGAVGNIAAGTGMSLETVGEMFARVAKGGEGASRAMMMFARQTGISTGELQKAGAEVVGGKLFTGTEEAAEKARQALENVANNRWPDAAKKAQGASAELAAAMTALQVDIGKAAAETEASATRLETSLVKAFHQDMSPSSLAIVGILAELTGKMASVAGQAISFAGSLGQVAMALNVFSTASEAAGAAQTATNAKQGASVAAIGAVTDAHFAEILALQQTSMAEAAEAEAIEVKIGVAQAEIETAQAQIAVMVERSETQGFNVEMCLSEAGALADLVASREADLATMQVEADDLLVLSAAHARSAEAAGAHAIATGGAAVASTGAVMAFLTQEITLQGLTACTWEAVEATVALIAANPLMAAFAAIAIGVGASLALLTRSQNEANAQDEEFLKTSLKKADALRQEHVLLGMHTDALRAHGASAKDVTNLIQGYGEAMAVAARAGNTAQVEKYRKLIEELKALLPELTAEENAHAAALQKTSDAMATAEHNYKMGTASLHDVIEARKAHIAVLQDEYDKAEKASKGGTGSADAAAKALKALRSEQEAQHQSEKTSLTESIALTEKKHQLGEASNKDILAGMYEQLAALDQDKAKQQEALDVRVKIHALKMQMLEEELAKEKEASDAALKLSQDRVDAIANADRTAAERQKSVADNDAKDAVTAAEAILSAHKAAGVETVADAKRVHDAEVAEAGAARDAKIQIANDELAKVTQTENDKVAIASQAAKRSADELRAIRATTHDPEVLRKYEAEVKQSADNEKLIRQQSYEAITAAGKNSSNDIADANRDMVNKNIAQANRERDAKLAAIESISQAILSQKKEMAGTEAASREKDLEKGVEGYGKNGVNNATLQTLSQAYLDAKKREADAERAEAEHTAEVKAAAAREAGDSQAHVDEYLAGARRAALAKWQQEQAEAIETVLSKLKAVNGAGQAKDLQTQLGNSQASLNNTEGVTTAVGRASAAADRAGNSVDGLSGALLKQAQAAIQGTSANAALVSSIESVGKAAKGSHGEQPGGGSFGGQSLASFGGFSLGAFGTNNQPSGPQSTDPTAMGYVKPQAYDTGFGSVNPNLSPGEQEAQRQRIELVQRAMAQRSTTSDVEKSVMYRQQMQSQVDGLSQSYAPTSTYGAQPVPAGTPNATSPTDAKTAKEQPNVDNSWGDFPATKGTFGQNKPNAGTMSKEAAGNTTNTYTIYIGEKSVSPTAQVKNSVDTIRDEAERQRTGVAGSNLNHI